MHETLLIALLALHLLMIQVGSAGPLLCVWLHWRYARREDAAAGRVGLRLAKWTLLLSAAGLVTGGMLVALLWQPNDGPYAEAMRRIAASKYWFALAELGFFYVCMVPYVLLWNAGRRWPIAHGLLAVLAATNLLYHFPPLLAVIATLATRSELGQSPIDAAAFRQLMLDSEVAARTVHAWLASFATAGVAVMWLGSREISSDETDPRAAAIIIVWAARAALVAALLQLLSGIWLLLTLPVDAQSAILGENRWAVALMLLSLSAAFALMHQLAAVALGEATRRTVVRSALLLAVTVLLMSGVSRLIS